MSVLAGLRAARARIANPKSWGQGMRPARYNVNSCCAAEAIEESITDTDDRKVAFRFFRYAVNIEDDIGAGGITEWNDDHVRSHADVMSAFNLAIAILQG